MELPIFQLDAFASRQFGGNPASVCPLPEWIPARTMQAIATENNQAETAFFVPSGSGYELRWFTPAIEVKLCGHATLASAFVLFEYLNFTGDSVTFETKSGDLAVRRLEDGRLLLDFPAIPPQRCQPHERLIDGLGTQPLEVLRGDYYLAIYPRERDVHTLNPNMDALAQLDRIGVIATAPGDEDGVDFVSRFFAPAAGIPEDPATGSAHCTLTPYWSQRLGRKNMHALQVSRRVGEFWVEDRDDRTWIAGNVKPYLRGTIEIE
ncbi:MAG: PhzF family phenazine biosynthesis protein [Bryobacteraceae bacterium]